MATVPLTYPLPDRTVELYLTSWIQKAGGRIPLEELEKKFGERFCFRPGFFIGEEVAILRGTGGRIFKLEGDMVSL